MSQDAPNWYVQQYTRQAIHKFQARGNMLKGMFMPPVKVEGSTCKFFIAGKGAATPLIRGARGGEMNASRGTVDATMQSWQANDWCYEDDLSKISVEYQGVLTDQAAMALGRRSDLIVINEINSASLTTIGNGSAAFGLVDALTGCQQLQAQDVPWDGNVYCGLPSKAWNQFLSFKQVNSADWVKDDLPYAKVTQAKRWNGVNWFLMPDEYAPVPSANQYDFFMWHRSAVGLGTGYDLKTTVSWENLYSGWYHNNRFSAAAKVLLPEGIIRFRYASNSAISLN